MRYALFALVGAVGVFLASRRVRVSNLTVACYCAFRFLLLCLFVVILHEKQIDMGGWVEHAYRMHGGEMPLRDFRSPYGMGFNALLWLPTTWGGGGFSIASVFLAFELTGFILFRKALCRLDKTDVSDQVSWLYMLSPVVLIFLSMGQQDEGVLLFFVSLLTYLLVARQEKWIPVVAVLGVLFTKALSVIYFAPFFLVLPIRRMKQSAVLLFTVTVAQVLLGLNPFSFQFERIGGAPDQIVQMVSRGSNVWYLISAMLGAVPPVVPEVCFVALVAWLLLYAFSIKSGKFENSIDIVSLSLGGVAFLVLTAFKMQSETYLTPVILPISYVLCKRRSVRCLVLFLLVEIAFCRNYYDRIFCDWLGLSPVFSGVVMSSVDCVAVIFLMTWIFRQLRAKGARHASILARLREYLKGHDQESTLKVAKGGMT